MCITEKKIKHTHLFVLCGANSSLLYILFDLTVVSTSVIPFASS